MTVLNFSPVASPYEGLADSLMQGYSYGTQARQNALSFPEQLKQLQSNTKLLDTQARYAEPLAQANLTQQQVLADYAQPNAAADLQKTQLANALAEITNRYAPRKNEADIGKTELENKVTGVNLKTLAEKNAAEIAEAQARAKYMEKGGAAGNRGTASIADEQHWQDVMQAYNPSLRTPEQKREANTVYAQGGTQLSDGTQLAPMVPEGELDRAFSASFKHGTTSPLITRGVTANQSEQEIPIIDDLIAKNPYGDTFGGINVQQIQDTFKPKDPAAMDRLSDYIVSDQMSLDKAALGTRMAGIESGVTILNEMMGKAKQSINAQYISFPAEARKLALKKYGEGLKDMLAARNRYGITASGAIGRGNRQTLIANNPNQSTNNSTVPVTKLVRDPITGKIVRAS